jgi:hypothetical protein
MASISLALTPFSQHLSTKVSEFARYAPDQADLVPSAICAHNGLSFGDHDAFCQSNTAKG